ncbi:MAG: hypothetical protein ABI867_20525 [Kofleriaceae bacterium]
MAKKWPPRGYPLVDGRHQLTDQWSLELPSQFARRIEEGSLVLWRPGLTIWLDAYGNDHRTSRTQRAKEMRSEISQRAVNIRETADNKITRLVYRLTESNAKGTLEAVYSFSFSDDGHLQMAVYFDVAADEAVADALAASVTTR